MSLLYKILGHVKHRPSRLTVNVTEQHDLHWKLQGAKSITEIYAYNSNVRSFSFDEKKNLPKNPFTAILTVDYGLQFSGSFANFIVCLHGLIDI